MTIETGTRIGRYEIQSLLGAGGMGEVYRAMDTDLSRPVALKFLPADMAADQRRMSRFVQEARAASALNHPNILTVYDIGQTDDGQRFFATEFVDGVTLREHIKRQRMKLGEILDVAIQAAGALVAAHSAGIVHRDIKPENIMVRRDGYVKVLDFGLAKLTGKSSPSVDTEAQTRALVNTDPGAVMGTVSYMSPEQARGLEVDHRTDIWSLGVVLYEMLTGHLPFEGKSPSHTVVAILDDEPSPLSHYVSEAPESLQEVVADALTKDREARFQTAKQFLAKLQRLRQRLEAGAHLDHSVAPNPTHSLAGVSSTGASGDSAAQQTAEALHRTTARSGEGAQATTSSVSSAEYVATEIKRHKKGVLLTLAAVLVVALAATGAFVWYKFYGRKPPEEQKRGELKITRLLTGARGTHGNVSVSPDGRYVVYSVVADGAASLWLRQISQDTATPIVAAVEDAFFSGTTFSPDGELVYFVSGNNKTNTLGSLYQVPVIGGREPKKILDHVSGPVSFSPDGQRFAFGRFFWQTGESALMTARVDGGEEPRKIASRLSATGWFAPRGVAWSPDGNRVAVVAASVPGGLSYSIIEVPAEGGEERLLTPHKWAGLTEHLRWLKDGTGLIVGAGEKSSDPRQLWHISYPEGSVRRVTNDFNDYGSFSVTADSSTLVANVDDNSSKIWVAAPGEDEGRARKITNGRQDGRNGIAWTPDGRIVYTAMSGDNQDIWIMNADGTGGKALTSDAYAEYWLNVSPDGRYIVFTSGRPDNTPHIWRMDIDGGNPLQLTDTEDYEPSFSPDGSWVVFISWRTGSPTIWKVPAGGGQAMQVSDLTAAAPFFSPDGKQLLFLYYDESVNPPRWRPALVSFETGQLIRIIESSPNARFYKWSRDGREFLYTEKREDVENIWSQPIAGGTPKQLTRFSADLIYFFDLSPDGKRLAIPRTTAGNEMVMIKGFR